MVRVYVKRVFDGRHTMDTLRPRSDVSAIIALFVLGMVPLGCRNPDSPLADSWYKFDRFFNGTPYDEVGSTHVAVLSVTRWDDYKKQLQPAFVLTEDKALKLAVADTLQTDQSLYDAFTASLGLKLAPSSVLPAGYKENDYAGADIPESGANSTRAGTIAKVEPNDIGSDPHLAYLAATALYQEVKLLNRYITDAAITQDYKAYVVQTQIACMPSQRGLAYDTYVDLGFFLDNIQVSESVGEPQRVSLPPLDDSALRAPDTKYRAKSRSLAKSSDVSESEPNYEMIRKEYDEAKDKSPLLATKNAIRELSTMRDRLKKLVDANGPEAPGSSVPKDGGRAVEISQEPKPEHAKIAAGLLPTISATVEELKKQAAQIGKQPRVIPLLVTDEVEAALMSRRAETLREIVLTLSAAYAGIGGKVDVDKLTSIVKSSFGRNYNSLLTVARQSDNVLRVRLGARQSPGGYSYEMVPQTHNVSLLLLVPAPLVAASEHDVYVGSRTTFAYCANGKWVRPPDAPDERVRNRLCANWKAAAVNANSKELNGITEISEPNKPNTWNQLVTHVANEEYESFVETLEEKGIKDQGLVNRMWFDLSIRGAKDYDKTTFAVPKYPESKAEIVGDKSQTVICSDDGKTTSATIFGVKDIDPVKVSAVWRVECTRDGSATGNGEGSKVASYAFPATTAALAPGERDLVLTFPSLAAQGLKPKDAISHPLSLCYPHSDGKYRDIEDVNKLTGLYRKTSVAAKQKAQITVQVAPEPLQANATSGNEARSLCVAFVRSPGVGNKDDISGYTITVSGPLVVSYKPTNTVIEEAPTKGLQVYTIKTDGQVVLQLTGLVADQTVKLTFTAPEGYESPASKEIKVVGVSTTRQSN
jgi:hypothetical protein